MIGVKLPFCWFSKRDVNTLFDNESSNEIDKGII